jgi:hypothetical protein
LELLEAIDEIRSNLGKIVCIAHKTHGRELLRIKLLPRLSTRTVQNNVYRILNTVPIMILLLLLLLHEEQRKADHHVQRNNRHGIAHKA